HPGWQCQLRATLKRTIFRVSITMAPLGTPPESRTPPRRLSGLRRRTHLAPGFENRRNAYRACRRKLANFANCRGSSLQNGPLVVPLQRLTAGTWVALLVTCVRNGGHSWIGCW